MTYCRLFTIAILWFTATAQAFDSQIFGTDAPVFSGRMQTCFSRAMVGMDSVINARLGVLPEHALAVTANVPQPGSSSDGQVAAATEQSFDEPILSVMLAAYLWRGSPHGYAIQVFYECAAAAPVMAERSDFLP